jgi:hypothetical protein
MIDVLIRLLSALGSFVGAARAELGRFERPDQGVLAGAVVQQRIRVQLDSQRCHHRVALDDCTGRLERPGRVMDVGAQRSLSLVDDVEAVALGQPPLERAAANRRACSASERNALLMDSVGQHRGVPRGHAVEGGRHVRAHRLTQATSVRVARSPLILEGLELLRSTG